MKRLWQDYDKIIRLWQDYDDLTWWQSCSHPHCRKRRHLCCTLPELLSSNPCCNIWSNDDMIRWWWYHGVLMMIWWFDNDVRTSPSRPWPIHSYGSPSRLLALKQKTVFFFLSLKICKWRTTESVFFGNNLAERSLSNCPPFHWDSRCVDAITLSTR